MSDTVKDPRETTEEESKTVTSETASFNDAEQTGAGYASGAPLKVVIYQISGTTDRGYGGKATV